ncbi:DUF4282 domain-containing protein [Branchiibius cervicis]|uniref:DUF4282 domain-containing protein n=1 Tax=Branchiibius cervicis TaxID=908252 RepID=A0ABW2AYX1_9MICO
MTDSDTPNTPDPQQPAQPGSLGQSYPGPEHTQPTTTHGTPAGGQPQAPYQAPTHQQAPQPAAAQQPATGQPAPGQPRPSQYQQPTQGYPQQGAPQGAPRQGYPQQGYPQQGYPQQGAPQQAQQPSGPGFGQQAAAVGGQFANDAGKVAKGAGDGLGALFSDLQFKKSLTGRLASIVFLGAIVWAVLNLLSNLTYYWGSTNGYSNMGGGSATFHTIADIIWLLFFIISVRILLEVALNIAKIAGRDKDSSSK